MSESPIKNILRQITDKAKEVVSQPKNEAVEKIEKDGPEIVTLVASGGKTEKDGAKELIDLIKGNKGEKAALTQETIKALYGCRSSREEDGDHYVRGLKNQIFEQLIEKSTKAKMMKVWSMQRGVQNGIKD